MPRRPKPPIEGCGEVGAKKWLNRAISDTAHKKFSDPCRWGHPIQRRCGEPPAASAAQPARAARNGGERRRQHPAQQLRAFW